MTAPWPPATRTVALGSLAVGAGIGVAASGPVALAGLSIPPAVPVTLIAAGAAVSYRRWGAPRGNGVMRTLVTGVAGMALVSGYLFQRTDDSVFSSLGDVVVVMLVVLSFGWVTAERCRTALVFSLAAVLFGASTRGNPQSLIWLAAWLAIAIVTLLAVSELPRADLRSFVAREGPPPGRAVHRAKTGLVVFGLVVLAALLSSLVDPRPPSSGSRSGSEADPSRKAAPYVGFSHALDTSRRGPQSDEKILTVWADAPDFWRGQTFDRFDGRTWTRSPAINARQVVSTQFGFLPSGVGDIAFQGQSYTQRVRVEAPFVDMAFASYRVEEVHAPETELVANGDGTVGFPQPLGRGAEYTVVSARPTVTADLLRTHDPLTGRVPAQISGPFEQLDGVSPRVRDLASSITGPAPSTYDKIRAVETWLGANTRYTLDIPPLPTGANTIDQYLFVDKKGFCEQIATATTMMLRSVGVPARLAVGFVPGDESLLGGEWTVRAKQAHAWVEVWFPDVGWQAFDPTASVPLNGEFQGSRADRLWRTLTRLIPVLILLAGLVLLTVVAVLVVRRMRTRRLAAQASWAERSLARLERAGSARGRPRAPPESPAAYASALAGTVLPDPRLVSVGAAISEATYAGQAPEPTVQAWADEVVAEAELAHPPPGRRRMGQRR
jgi:transglutaminase-like putative cysteine protease